MDHLKEAENHANRAQGTDSMHHANLSASLANAYATMAEAKAVVAQTAAIEQLISLLSEQMMMAEEGDFADKEAR